MTAQASKRLMFLEKVTREGSDDVVAWYGLAMEYRSLERWDEALQTFTTLRSKKPDYVPQYLMCGQMLAKLARKDEARAWLEAGVEAARASKNAHALGELEEALGTLDDDD
jgi:predicted Zn-dependent protease